MIYRVVVFLLARLESSSSTYPIVNPDYAIMIDSTSILLNRTDGVSPLIPIRNPAPDIDIGPWCKFNKTSGLLVNGPETIWPVYNYTMPNSTCGADKTCSLPGCVMYRETWYKSGIESWLGCSVVFPWWYGAGAAGNRTSIPCPLFDNLTSTFDFRGSQFYNLMFNYGHSYGPTDCHKNILCSTAAIWFDDTQYSTLKWCQPTPVGWFSPQCNNTKFPCDSGGVDMATKYYTTHGMGKATGCGIRMTSPAWVSGTNSEVPLGNLPFSLSADVSLLSPSINTSQTSPTVLFGLFPHYYLGIQALGITNQFSVALFHSKHTVTSSKSYINSDPFSWTGTLKNIAVQSDGVYLSFWVDNVWLSQTPITGSTASIGGLNLTGLPKTYYDGSLMHVGFVSVGLPSDFISPTTTSNPYSVGVFADLKISNIKVTAGIQYSTTTTTTSTTTPTTTPTLTTVIPQLPTTTTTTTIATATATTPPTTATTITTPTLTITTITPPTPSMPTRTSTTTAATTTAPITTLTTSTPTPRTPTTASTTASGAPLTDTTTTTTTTEATTHLSTPLTTTTSTRMTSTATATSTPFTAITTTRTPQTTTTATSAPTTPTTSPSTTTSTQPPTIAATQPLTTTSTATPTTDKATPTSNVPPTSTTVMKSDTTSSARFFSVTVVIATTASPTMNENSFTSGTLEGTDIRNGNVREGPSGSLTESGTDGLVPEGTKNVLLGGISLASFLILIMIFVCVCRYKFDGPLILVKRGSRRVDRVHGPSAPF